MQARGLRRIARLPARVRRTIVAMRTLRNWGEFLLADLGMSQLDSIRTRGGVVLRSSVGTNLKFLFDEIWLHRVYTPAGYEPKAGDLVIDIGANIGVFAIYAASRATGITVLAYEPFPESARVLRLNVASSSLTGIRVLEKAVAGDRGERVLETSSGNSVMNALRASGTGASTRNGTGLRVECVSLDDVFQANLVKWCDLLKLDCEGSEYEILRQCSAHSWARIGRVVVEYHEGPGVDGTRDELVSLLTARGFTIDRIEQNDHRTGYICARAAGLPVPT